MRLLHIASFQGNFGDRVNHLAFRTWFSELFPTGIEWLEFEVRSVFRKEIDFREAVTAAARDVDAIVIGGGGFWELWPEDYWSGTSLDLDPDFLQSVEKPVFFNALGVDDGRGVGRTAEKNFGDFLAHLLADSKYLVTVRNDGSLRALKDHFGVRSERITESPDHGFFAPDFLDNLGSPIGGKYVAVSLAQDMPDTRFRAGFNPEGLIAETVQSIETLVKETDVSFALVPHIYSDLDVYSRLLRSLGDKTRRERIIVMPLQTALTTGHQAVDAYRNASVAWTMRFHASALAIGSGVPTIGLLSYPKVRSIFSESSKFLGAGIEVSKGDFAEQLAERSLEYLGSSAAELKKGRDEDTSRFIEQLEVKRSDVGAALRLWAKKNDLI